MGCPLSKSEIEVMNGRPLSAWELDAAECETTTACPEWYQQIRPPVIERRICKNNGAQIAADRAYQAQLQILAWLSMNPNQTRRQIADALGFEQETTRGYLVRLYKSGHIDSTKYRGTMQWSIK